LGGTFAEVSPNERWLGKKRIAEHFDCSVRWIERRMEEGLPHAHIAGRAKFQVTVVAAWLDEHGFIERRGDQPA
jgi:hypothetical protein